MGDSIVISDIRARVRAKRRRTALMVRIFVFGLCGTVLLGWTIGALAAFTQIRQVTIRCSDATLAYEVSQSFRLPVQANLITSRLSHLVREVERLPRVKSVQFRRQFPDRLILVVEPRQPVIAFNKRGRYLLVDREGMCLAWTTRPPRDLLRVEGMAINADVGQRIGGEWFDCSRVVLDAISSAERFGPWVLDVHNPPELSLITGSGVRGIVGHDCDELGRRARIFVEALKQFEAQGKSIGLMELRTERPIVWSEHQRPDRPGGPAQSLAGTSGSQPHGADS